MAYSYSARDIVIASYLKGGRTPNFMSNYFWQKSTRAIQIHIGPTELLFFMRKYHVFSGSNHPSNNFIEWNSEDSKGPRAIQKIAKVRKLTDVF